MSTVPVSFCTRMIEDREDRRAEGQQHVTVARLALDVALLRQQHRHHEDDRHLGELRRLQRHAARQVDPGACTGDPGADPGHERHEQQEHRQAVDDRRVGPQPPVVDPRGEEAQDDADDHVDAGAASGRTADRCRRPCLRGSPTRPASSRRPSPRRPRSAGSSRGRASTPSRTSRDWTSPDGDSGVNRALMACSPPWCSGVDATPDFLPLGVHRGAVRSDRGQVGHRERRRRARSCSG